MLSTTTEYALRAMAWLAQQPQAAVVLGRDLARDTDSPQAYLTKILLALRNAGLVEAIRGTGGGYRLHKPAAKILLIDIVEVFEGRNTGAACLLQHDKVCSDHDPCSGHAVWGELRQNFLRLLRSSTLADIAGAGLPLTAATQQPDGRAQ